MTPAAWIEVLEMSAAVKANRNALIRAAHAGGVTKNRIHVVTGLARTTIDRILAQ